nr:hypothetical protein Iba_chr10bCG0960 [Ipomoea batatas]GMD44519.1 hypothetical protein Iba_chr10dCG1280 [Ipomoea batatas]
MRIWAIRWRDGKTIVEQKKWWIVAVMNDRRISYRRRPDGEEVSGDQHEMRVEGERRRRKSYSVIAEMEGC